ncbi:MAG: chemotaxis protein CheA [Melioribacteraceae bacterium]|jgi:two-component system chemotaxis sensor kinase CheA|nr:chemotaxis protein CheA [Melioribacteraceae bacterium]
MSDENKYAMLIDPDMAEIVDSFVVETHEILEELDHALVELENKPEDDDLLNKIFRAFHTIKGTSGFLGLEKLTAVTHRGEDILNKLRKGEAKLSSELMDVILVAYDKIKELIIVIENDKNENVETSDTVAYLENAIKSLENNVPIVSQAKVATPSVVEEPTANVQEEVAEVVKNEELESSVDSKEVVIENPVEAPPEIIIAKEKKVTAKPQKKSEDTNIRVDVERLDELLNIVSELVLGRNQLAQVNSEATLEYEGTKLSRDLAEATKQIDIMTNELQLVVMKTRMVKVGKVFNRFPRVVRDLSKEMEKNVNLVIKGEETELDKTLIEEINDPLVHLVRNSVDHGIESPEERIAKGKNPKGTLTLSATHEGNHVIISIEDDGKGINPEVSKNKAIEKGLITKEKAEDLSDTEIFNFIFAPGFSTAAVVTNVSGRGVGMDVVRTNVTKLRGIINIESKVDNGSKIIIKLPLTLAIISGMVVRSREEMMVIPLSSVVEVLRVHTDEIYSVNNNPVIKVRDRVIPLVSIDKLLYNQTEENLDKVFQFIVIVGVAEKVFGIKVDEMIGQKEVVIKSLGNYLGNIEGIAGSSIMGDGRVVMILDIAELLLKINRQVEASI